MFGTLKIGSEKNSTEFIEHAKGEAAGRLGGYVFSHSACERCRLKKLRCDKHKSGCDRCKVQDLKCSYETTAESSSSRPKSRSHCRAKASTSNTSETTCTSNALSPMGHDDVDQEIGWWQLAENDSIGNDPANTSHPLRDLNRVDQIDHSNLRDFQLDYCEDELDDAFSNIAALHPDDIQTNVLTGATSRAFLDAEAFDSITETEHSMLDDIGDMALSQPGSVDAHQSLTAADHARSRTGSSSCQCQRTILHVLAEIESKIISTSPSNMYAMLSYQRRTTTASNAILAYDICKCRIELFGLLGIIAEKITSLSEAIITAFVCRVKGQNGSVDFGGSDSSDKRLDCYGAIRLGEFQVQTLQEFKVVSAAVINLQLKNSVNFVSRTRELAVSMNRLAQAQSLKKLQGRLKELFIKVQQMNSGI